jgi:hypothetical protein
LKDGYITAHISLSSFSLPFHLEFTFDQKPLDLRFITYTYVWIEWVASTIVFEVFGGLHQSSSCIDFWQQSNMGGKRDGADSAIRIVQYHASTLICRSPPPIIHSNAVTSTPYVRFGFHEAPSTSMVFLMFSFARRRSRSLSTWMIPHVDVLGTGEPDLH